MFLKSIPPRRAKLKSESANSALRSLRIRPLRFSTPTFSHWLKTSLKKKKIAHLHLTSCHTMSVGQMPSFGEASWRAILLARLFQGRSISAGATSGELGTTGFILKILGNKNLTCRNLSGALVLWHFIKMLAMKSEPIFWLSRNYKIQTFPQKKPSQ